VDEETPTADSSFLADFFRSETVGGSIALVAAVVAVVWANFGASSYAGFRGAELGPLDVEHWAADGALAVFFFVAGLELKRELLVGSLRRPVDAAVPVVAACAGVAVPAAIFVAVNAGTDNLAGWAVPAATDIAFALAVLSVVGSALPDQLRAFLLTLAVVDDLIVIVVIAFFYTDSLHPAGLVVALIAFVAYAVLQRRRIRTPLVYVPLAAIAWACVHESGVHATVAGVVLGLLTRALPDDGEDRSPAERLEHRLSPLSSGLVVPLFALTSAGVSLHGGLDLHEPVVLGVLLALVVGKPVGVLGGAFLTTRLTRARLDPRIGWRDLTGVALACGVGFTVSLLVSDLAFVGEARDQAKSAVLLGSLVSGCAAAIVLGRRNRIHRRR
jgi:NhaA family Na+:H+ antiporter